MAIDGRRFWSNSVNRDMLRVARGQSYGGDMICLAPGLHVSKFSLDHDATVERLQNIVGGSLRPCSILCEPWKGGQKEVLAALKRLVNGYSVSPAKLIVWTTTTRVWTWTSSCSDPILSVSVSSSATRTTRSD